MAERVVNFFSELPLFFSSQPLKINRGTINSTIANTKIMDIHTASHARANLFKLLEKVNQDSEPCIITSRKGDGVLISKDDWESIQETLYLESIPEMKESIKEGMATPLENCVSEDRLEW